MRLPYYFRLWDLMDRCYNKEELWLCYTEQYLK